MINKVCCFSIFLKFMVSAIICLFFLSAKEASSFGEDNLYDDPGVLRIYVQHRVLKTLSSDLREDLNNFTKLSAHKQQKFLKVFKATQDQLEREYKGRKAGLANERLTKYGISCVVSLAVPALAIMILNTCLPDDNKINFGALPFVVLQGSSFFFFKFLEVLSQKYIASNDGALREYEIKYVRNKPLLEEDFCKVFESKLVAAHKSGANIYDYLKWFNAAIHLPIAKKEVSVKCLEENFESEFSIFPQVIKNKVRRLCLRHILQKHSRVIAYFYGPSGTGKTRCARSIAHCLGLPFGSMALAHYSVSDLIGQGGIHLPHPGKFAETILNAKDQDGESYDNMVLLVDEVDEITEEILSFLLTFLDPDTDSYYSPYFEKNIRIKNLLIILAGMQLPEKNDVKRNAIRKRAAIKIKFPEVNKEYKKEYVVNHYIPQLYSETEEPYKLDIEKHFSEEDKEELSRFIDKDEDPGLRSVQEKAREFVDNKIVEIFLKEN